MQNAKNRGSLNFEISRRRMSLKMRRRVPVLNFLKPHALEHGVHVQIVICHIIRNVAVQDINKALATKVARDVE